MRRRKMEAASGEDLDGRRWAQMAMLSGRIVSVAVVAEDPGSLTSSDEQIASLAAEMCVRQIKRDHEAEEE
jgi:hypothetical protein